MKKIVKISYSMEIARATIFNFMFTPLKKRSLWPNMALPCTYAKKVHNPVLFSSLPWHRARPSMHISPPMNLVSRDLWRGGSPPLRPGIVPCPGRVIMWQVTWLRGPSSLPHKLSPTPRLACVWGGVSMGPAVCHGPGAISMKEDWVQGYKGTRVHTQTSYAGTRDN